jgi:hypothetical protein
MKETLRDRPSRFSSSKSALDHKAQASTSSGYAPTRVQTSALDMSIRERRSGDYLEMLSENPCRVVLIVVIVLTLKATAWQEDFRA